jgi:hypothetical protein
MSSDAQSNGASCDSHNNTRTHTAHTHTRAQWHVLTCTAAPAAHTLLWEVGVHGPQPAYKCRLTTMRAAARAAKVLADHTLVCQNQPGRVRSLGAKQQAARHSGSCQPLNRSWGTAKHSTARHHAHTRARASACCRHDHPSCRQCREPPPSLTTWPKSDAVLEPVPKHNHTSGGGGAQTRHRHPGRPTQ